MKLLYILIFVIASSSAQEWAENGNYEYYFDSLAIINDYQVAAGKCNDMGATLTTVKTSEVEDFISGITGIITAPILIGLKRVSNSANEFRWIDETPLLETDYQNWAIDEPDNENKVEDCVILIGSPTEWKDFSCRGVFHYICQRGSDYTGTSTTTTLTTSVAASTETNSIPGDATTSPSSCNCDDSSTEKEEQLKTLLIIVISVAGGIILILVIVVLVLVHYKNKRDDDGDSDSETTDKDRKRQASAQSNMSYMWNSLPSHTGEKLTRDIPRPSVVGTASTMSYYHKAFNRGPFSDVELDYLPEDKEYTLPSQPEYRDNNMYSKLNMIR